MSGNFVTRSPGATDPTDDSMEKESVAATDLASNIQKIIESESGSSLEQNPYASEEHIRSRTIDLDKSITDRIDESIVRLNVQGTKASDLDEAVRRSVAHPNALGVRITLRIPVFGKPRLYNANVFVEPDAERSGKYRCYKANAENKDLNPESDTDADADEVSGLMGFISDILGRYTEILESDKKTDTGNTIGMLASVAAANLKEKQA